MKYNNKIAHILKILIIGVIGVQTFTACGQHSFNDIEDIIFGSSSSMEKENYSSSGGNAVFVTDYDSTHYIYTPKTKLESISEEEYTVEVKNYTYTVNSKKSVTVYYSLPNKITDNTKVMFVIPGSGRNPESYAQRFRYFSEKENIAVISPKFTSKMFPDIEYNAVNIAAEQQDWTCYILDSIFEGFVEQFKLKAQKYILFGHSAGGQFAIRTAVFSDSKYIELVIASSQGAYTFFDESLTYPNGIKDKLEYKETFLQNLRNRKTFVLIGSKDDMVNNPDIEPGFDEQGAHRLQRAINFHNASGLYSEANGIVYQWKTFVMKGLGHSGGGNSSAFPYILDILKDNYQ